MIVLKNVKIKDAEEFYEAAAIAGMLASMAKAGSFVKRKTSVKRFDPIMESACLHIHELYYRKFNVPKNPDKLFDYLSSIYPIVKKNLSGILDPVPQLKAFSTLVKNQWRSLYWGADKSWKDKKRIDLVFDGCFSMPEERFLKIKEGIIRSIKEYNDGRIS